MTKHTYPSEYPPGSHWAIDEAWRILDRIAPGVIPDDVRAFLAGYIAGALMRERGNLSGTDLLSVEQAREIDRSVAHSSAVTADLVEAVARAICEAEKMNPDDAMGGWVHWVDAAAAAIEAIPNAAQPPLVVTDEMLNAHIKALGNWAEPFTAERESGVAIDSDISQEDADFFNDEERKRLRVGYAAALKPKP